MKKITYKSFKAIVAVCIFVSMMIVTSVNSKHIEALSESDNMRLDINTTTPIINTGEEMRFSVDYSFSNLEQVYSNVVLEITMPAEIAGATITASNMPVAYTTGETAQITPVIVGNKITYTVPTDKQIEPGYASSVALIKVATSRMLTIPGIIQPQATLKATLTEVETISDVENVEIRINPNWKVVKTPQFTTYNENSYVRYRMYVQAQNVNGNIGAKSFVITDTIPAGTTFVAFDDPNDANINQVYPSLNPSNPATWQSAKIQPYSNIPASYPAGSASYSGGLITWTIPESSAIYTNASYMELTYWVKISNHLLDEDNPVVIKNSATLNAKLLNNQDYTNTQTSSISVIKDTGTTENAPAKSIHFTNKGYGKDTSFIYFDFPTSTLYNKSSTTDIKNYIIEDNSDDWSDSLTLKDVYIPSMVTGNDTMINMSYKVEFYNGTTLLTTYSYTTGTSRRISAPTGADRYRIIFDTIPRGTGGSGSSLGNIIVGFAYDSQKDRGSDCVSNRATFTYTFAGEELSTRKGTSCQVLSDEGAASVTLSKSIVSPKSFYTYDDTINFKISYSNSLYSGKSADNVVFYDLLPAGVKFVPNSTVGAVQFVDVVEDFNGTGRQRVGWKLTSPLAANGSGSFTFSAYVSESVLTQTYTNEVYMMADTPLDTNFDFSSYPQDTIDINQNGDTKEPAIRSSVNFDGVAYSGVLVIKEVKGDLDSEWSRYPAFGTVSASGQFQYRMTVKNLSSQPMSNIRMIDILPYINDVGVLTSSSRDSQWTPVLKSSITQPAGTTITYSTSSNPNRGPIGRPAIGEASTTWLSTVPADITTVRSIKVEYPGTLAANSSFVLTYDMVSPVGAPSSGEIAWNSFGMQAQNPNGSQVLPVEPKKVGIMSVPPIKKSIGGRTWLDDNRNGILDSGENGLNGILVYLVDGSGNRIMNGGNPVYTVTANNMSGQPGYYQFNNLDPNDYYVEFEEISGYGRTPSTDFNNPLNTNHSDYNVNTRRTAKLQLSNSDIRNIDGGFTLSSIGDFVFNDSNYNGIQDTGELGMPNIPVKLYKNGTLAQSTTTDSNGAYAFTNLLTGNYEVRVTKPTLYDFSPSLQGSDTALDSNFTPLSLQVGKANVALALDANHIATTDTTIDCGLSIGTGILSGQAWDDLKRDNVFGHKPVGGNDEDFIANVQLKLYNSENVVVATTTTDTNGQYSFNALPIDTYKVEVILPSGTSLVIRDAGFDDSIDSDFSPVTKLTDPITIARNQHKQHIDAGLYTAPKGSVNGRVYLDDNYNCTQDLDEHGFNAFTVELFDRDLNVVVATTTTNANGDYTFNGVGAGNYTVRFKTADGSIYKIGNASAVTTPTTSSLDIDVELADNNTNLPDTPTGGTCILYRESGIGDYVWLDLNRDGLQDADEPGLEGVIVKLYDESMTLVDQTSTDSNGHYYFSNLQTPDNYKIEFTLPSNDYRFTQPNVDDGSGGSALNSLAMVTGDPHVATIDFVLDPNVSITIYDAGVVYTPASIGDKVFFDKDQVSVQNANSLPLANIKLDLYRTTIVGGDEYIASTISDNTGAYLFETLDPGNYFVKIDESTIPPFLRLVPKGLIPSAIDSDFDRITARTDTIHLSAGENNNDLDAGFGYKPVTIGDFVWIDANHNGIQDVNELPMVNAHLSLYKDINGTLTYLTDTYSSETGNYGFVLLDPYTYDGETFTPYTYYVGIDTPPLMHISNQYHTGVEGSDNDFHLVNTIYLSDPITMSTTTYTESVLIVDAAVEFDTGTIGDFVWFDANRNGIYDNAEQPMENVEVKLYQDIGGISIYITSAITDENGNYLFEDLDPGRYRLEIVPPTNYNLTLYKVGTAENQNDFCPLNKPADEYAGLEVVDCNGVESNYTPWMDLQPDQNLLYNDAGLQTKYAKIGDFVWMDRNANGIQDSGEPGVANVSMRLIDIFGFEIQVTTSDADGFYQFLQVEPGEYSVEVVMPSAYTLSQDHQGDPDKDSNMYPIIDESEKFIVSAGQVESSIDVGLVPKPSSIGDFVWLDLNRNGQQDILEPGVKDVTVSLYEDVSGTWILVGQQTTDEFGAYLFKDLLPGSYKLKIDVPSKHALTMYHVGIVSMDSDFCPSLQSEDDYKGLATVDCDSVVEDETITIVLGPNEMVTTIDAGLQQQYANIGNYVWFDANRNGLQDEGEQGMANVKLNLIDSLGDIIQTTTSDENGLYRFKQVEPGTYHIEYEALTDYQTTIAHSTLNTQIDSDFTLLESDEFTLEVGETQDDIDLGLVAKYSSIGDKVWIDANRNGIQDPDEKAMANVKLSLYDENNMLISTTISDPNGFYLFDQLEAGIYHIEYESLQDYQTTLYQSGNDPLKDNDFDGNNSSIITLAINQNIENIDLGLIPLYSSIGNYVWYDVNRNGIQDANETGMANIKLSLYDSNDNLIKTTVSDENGYYIFDKLEAGSYYIIYDKLDDYLTTSYHSGNDESKDDDFEGLKSSIIQLSIHQDIEDIDLGLVAMYSSIGDFVWNDKNKNGIQDPDEKGLASIPVTLKTKDGKLLSTTKTDVAGFYQFSELEAGEYCVSVEVKDTYTFTLQNVGDDNKDSDFSNTNNSVCVNLALHEDNASIDAGMYLVDDDDSGTGDTTSLNKWLTLLVLSLGIVVITSRQRKQTK